MVSAFYVVSWSDDDATCDVLMHRTYHSHLPSSAAIICNFEDRYKHLKPHERVPVLVHNGLSYVYIETAGVLFMAVVTQNANVMSLVVFLHNFAKILSQYLVDAISEREKEREKEKDKHKSDKEKHKDKHKEKKKEKSLSDPLNKDTIRDNLILIFDLLDECLDFGVVQLTDYNILKEYIKMQVNVPRNDSDSEDAPSTHKSHQRTSSKDVRATYNQANTEDVVNQDTSVVNSSVLRTYASGINWRPKGIFYAKNEIYIDIVERAEFLHDLDSATTKKNEVGGTCYVKCYLSGMPLCKLGFNEKNISGIDNRETKKKNKGGSEDGSDEKRTETTEDPPKDLEDLSDSPNPSAPDPSDPSAPSAPNPSAPSAPSGPNPPPSAPDPSDPSNLIQASDSDPEEPYKHLISIRNIQFHQCIKLNALYRENLVTFVPPDDRFELMTYNVELQNHVRKLPLVMVEPKYRVMQDSRRLQIMCVLKTNIKKRLHCHNLVVKLPVNPNLFDIDTRQLKYKAEAGEVNYKLDSSELWWSLSDTTGRKTVRMMAELPIAQPVSPQRTEATLNNTFVPESGPEDSVEHELDSFYGVNGTSSSVRVEILDRIKRERSFNHVHVSFTIPMMSYSGLKLNYLKVDEELMKYTCFPWVKYVTEATDGYKFRLGMGCFEFENT